MRLLHAASLKFKEFPDATIPPYAVLSHTWEEKQEVTLQDMASLYLTDKMGYAKIAATCALALQRGLEWAWIDTCCIDKTNNTELTESINSMFSWYQNATVCFVHLVDLNASPSAAADASNDVYGRMRQCAWFKRGWTLQELLAPLTVEFYDTNWSPIGSKADLAPLLADITRIPVPAILGQERLTNYSAAQIMAWASRRATTRVEDEAYCLLGLFDVYMPLIYGEGKQAFQRLQEEILKRTTDLTLFAWLTPEEAAAMDLETAHSLQSLTPSNRSAYMPLLASSPAEFEHCRGLSRFRNDDSEFAVTNRGLRITTYLVLVPLSTEFALDSQPSQRHRHSHHPSVGSGGDSDVGFGSGGASMFSGSGSGSASNSPTPPVGMDSGYRKPTTTNLHTRYRYVLSVGFSRSAASEIGIWLKKVGPGLFLRDANLPLAFLSKSKLRYTNTTENLTFYIMPQPVSSLPSSKMQSSASAMATPAVAYNSRMSTASLASTLPPATSSVLSPMSPHGGGFDSPLLTTHAAAAAPPTAPDSGLSAHQQLCSVYHPRLYPRGMYIPDFRDRNISFGYFPPQPWDEYTRIYCQPESRNDVVAFSCSSRQGPDGRDKLSFGVLIDHRIKRDGPRCLVISRHHIESRLLFMQAMRQQGEPLRWYAIENELPLITTSTNMLRMTVGSAHATAGQGQGQVQSPTPANTRTYEVVASIVESRVHIDEHSVTMPTLDIKITRVQ
ncbi:hypothetical protein SEUCBS139899_009787 [Sporothrix eucalyptigena]|uniref:Heterokaryon incompatibility domain-containing protein n=1 Tax=Sporothrix eucalyptigena TaxID=1812306 RepID=A0ABP0CZD8_9PEZI